MRHPINGVDWIIPHGYKEVMEGALRIALATISKGLATRVGWWKKHNRLFLTC